MSTVCDGAGLGRRDFIVLTGVGALATWSSMPAAWSAAVSTAPSAQFESIADWTIDDMWGVYPRYAEAIGYGRRNEGRQALLTGADEIFAAYV